MIFFDETESPIGTLQLRCIAAGLTHLLMRPQMRQLPAGAQRGHELLEAAKQQLASYFAGGRAVFDLPLAPVATAFQQRVWRALRTIPAGETRSYGEIAVMIGRPTASRAVGAANGANSIGIIVPCHRVVGSNGKLVGYAGGLDRKRWLLAHESESFAEVAKAAPGATLFACR